MRTQFANYNGTPSKKTFGISKTVPDMSKTIRQLYTSNVRQSINENNGLYFEEEVIPRFTDLTEQAEYKQQKIQDLEDQVKNIKEESAQTRAKKAEQKANERREIIEQAKKELRESQNN